MQWRESYVSLKLVDYRLYFLIEISFLKRLQEI